MMQVRAFEKADLAWMQSQEASSWLMGMGLDLGTALESNGMTKTVLYKNEIVLVGGAVKLWNDRYEVWGIVGRKASECALTLTRIVKGYLVSLEAGRLEATCEASALTAAKWIRLMGFKEECSFMDSFFGSGKHGKMFSMVNYGR